MAVSSDWSPGLECVFRHVVKRASYFGKGIPPEHPRVARQASVFVLWHNAFLCQNLPCLYQNFPGHFVGMIGDFLLILE